MARNFSQRYQCEPVDFLNRNPPLLRHICVICNKLRQKFFCVNCVRCGSLYHSSYKDCERYADKRLKQLSHNEEEKKILQEISRCLKKRLLYQQKYRELKECRQRIAYLQMAKKEVEDTSCKYETALQEMDDAIDDLNTKCHKFHLDVLRALEAGLVGIQHNLKEQKEMLETHKEAMKKIVRKHARRLLSDIFPIEKIIHDSATANFGIFYSIVNKLCVIPADGNYKELRLSENQGAISSGEPTSMRGNHIFIAFGYFCQLMQLLSHLLQVPLPKQIAFRCFSEFSRSSTPKHHQAHVVAKLNINIAHLCYSQGITVKDPTLTGYNVKALLDSPQLGRLGPFTVPHEVMELLEQDLLDEEPFVTEPLEEEVDHGWDFCSHRDAPHLPETPTSSSSVAQSSQGSIQPTLMSSAIDSFWKILGQK